MLDSNGAEYNRNVSLYHSHTTMCYIMMCFISVNTQTSKSLLFELLVKDIIPTVNRMFSNMRQIHSTVQQWSNSNIKMSFTSSS
jgi:hypothetical protein